MTILYGAIGFEDANRNLLENIVIPFDEFAKFLDALDKWSDPDIMPLNYCLFRVMGGKYLTEPVFTNEPVLPDLNPSGFLMGFQNSDVTIEVSRADTQRYLNEIDDTIRHCDKMAVGIVFNSNQGIAITTFDYMAGGSPN